MFCLILFYFFFLLSQRLHQGFVCTKRNEQKWIVDNNKLHEAEPAFELFWDDLILHKSISKNIIEMQYIKLTYLSHFQPAPKRPCKQWRKVQRQMQWNISIFLSFKLSIWQKVPIVCFLVFVQDKNQMSKHNYFLPSNSLHFFISFNGFGKSDLLQIGCIPVKQMRIIPRLSPSLLSYIFLALLKDPCICMFP